MNEEIYDKVLQFADNVEEVARVVDDVATKGVAFLTAYSDRLRQIATQEKARAEGNPNEALQEYFEKMLKDIREGRYGSNNPDS